MSLVSSFRFQVSSWIAGFVSEPRAIATGSRRKLSYDPVAIARGSDTTSFCARSKLSVNIRASSSNSNFHERAREIGWRVFVSKTMAEEPTFKVVDRRPFNPDGTPRELSPEEKE